MIEMNPYYTKTMVPPSKLHFTLGVFNLEDQERFERMKWEKSAMSTVDLNYVTFRNTLPFILRPIRVELHYKDSTVFVKMCSISRLLPTRPCTST